MASTLTTNKTIAQPYTGALYVAVRVRNRTAGSVTCTIQGSPGPAQNPTVDPTWEGLGTEATTGALTVDGTYYLRLTRSTPNRLRVVLTPAGGFNGRVTVGFYTAYPLGG